MRASIKELAEGASKGGCVSYPEPPAFPPARGAAEGAPDRRLRFLPPGPPSLPPFFPPSPPASSSSLPPKGAGSGEGTGRVRVRVGWDR